MYFIVLFPTKPTNLQPEEIASDVATPNEATQPQAPADLPSGGAPPPVYEENKSKYKEIGSWVRRSEKILG